jgi:argininosuccinate lyase
LAYNRDLQEDKPPIFDAFETVLACVELSAAVIEKTELNETQIAESLPRGFLDATTLMEQLIRLGIPMRTAHEAVGGLVRTAMQHNCTLADLEDACYDRIAPGSARAIKSALGARRAVAAFVSFGSTGPDLVREQLASWKVKLS